MSSLLIVLASACAVPADVGHARGAIIDGRIAAESDVGATVATLKDGTLDCSGTLVTARVVITAAHCLLDDDWEALLPVSALEVVVGAVDATMAPEAQTYAVSLVWVSPEFPGDELSDVGLYDEHDIGAIVLSRDVTGVTPMPILSADEVEEQLAEGRMLQIAGYGVKDRRGREDNTMLYVAELPLIERSDRELIAGEPDGVDTCDGDSGGPAWIDTGAGPRLVGVNSRSVDADREVCDTGSVFTLAPAYAAAIEAAIGEEMNGDGAVDPPPVERAPRTVGDGCSTAHGGDLDSPSLTLFFVFFALCARRLR